MSRLSRFKIAQKFGYITLIHTRTHRARAAEREGFFENLCFRMEIFLIGLSDRF